MRRERKIWSIKNNSIPRILDFLNGWKSCYPSSKWRFTHSRLIFYWWSIISVLLKNINLFIIATNFLLWSFKMVYLLKLLVYFDKFWQSYAIIMSIHSCFFFNSLQLNYDGQNYFHIELACAILPQIWFSHFIIPYLKWLTFSSFWYHFISSVLKRTITSMLCNHDYNLTS